MDSAIDICSSSAANYVKQSAGCFSDGALPSALQIIITSIIAILGLVAVVYIIVGGVRLMTSTGDPGKVTKAKQTILYALIGLVICALAFAITNWVIGIANSSSSSTESTEDADTLSDADREELPRYDS